MTDLRENIGWVIGGALAAIAAFLGWFYESGLISTIVGIVIGAGIAFFVQTRTQKRAWKREYSIKVVEEVYAPLFKDVGNIVNGLEGRSYWGFSFPTWREIKNSHKYLMIDEPFRTRVDELNKALEKYTRTIGKVRGKTIPQILSEEAKKFFELDTNVRTQLSLKAGNSSYSIGDNLVEYLLKGNHPHDEVVKWRAEYKNVESYALQTEKGTEFNINETKKFDDFWFSCVERAKENPTVQFLLKENERILGDAQKLKEELTKRIQEPWNI